jgi:purine-binding chemotaxis protein CheW
VHAGFVVAVDMLMTDQQVLATIRLSASAPAGNNYYFLPDVSVMNPILATSGMLEPGVGSGARQAGRQVGLQILEFVCRGRRFAIPLACVRRAVFSARPEPLPGASDIVLGVLNIGGQTVTVLDFARRAGCGPTVISAAQQFLIVELKGFLCAFVVDAINGPGLAEQDAFGWPDEVEVAGFVDSALRLPDGLCLVIDPARFLFEHEQAQLAQALAEASDERN